MRNYIEGIPHRHTAMTTGTYLGVTDGGLPFNLDVERDLLPLNSNGYARAMMDIRIRAAAEAKATGRPLGVDLRISPLAPEERTEITMRIVISGKIQRVAISINDDGSYSALSRRRSSLRDIVRDVASLAESGIRLAPARIGM